MAALETPLCEFGKQAIDFNLLGVDDQLWTLQQCRGEQGLLVMFICNHCPYVKAVHERIVRDTSALKHYGINAVAIMSNDTAAYPDDGIDNMKRIAKQHNYNFPYVLDDTQQVAKDYGAVCTPDFFGYNANLELQYRGRLDASRKETAPDGTIRELFEAMMLIAKTGQGPRQQVASMGCSIKWK